MQNTVKFLLRNVIHYVSTTYSQSSWINWCTWDVAKLNLWYCTLHVHTLSEHTTWSMAELIDTMFWQEACTFVFHKGPIQKLLPHACKYTCYLCEKNVPEHAKMCNISFYRSLEQLFETMFWQTSCTFPFHKDPIVHFFSEPCKYACNFVVKECPSACPGVWHIIYWSLAQLLEIMFSQGRPCTLACRKDQFLQNLLTRANTHAFLAKGVSLGMPGRTTCHLVEV